MRRQPRIVVAGSLNYDLAARVDHLPEPGEAVAATELRPDLGGKGFNQAVACRGLGASVDLIGAVGDDPFAKQFIERLDQVEIGRQHLASLVGSTGLAVPVVDTGGQNFIVVGLGANLRLPPDAIEQKMFDGADAVLLQGELLPETTLRAAQYARAAGATVILNAAPADLRLAPVVATAAIVVVNQVESQTYGGASGILEAGAGSVVITLGAAGAELHSSQPGRPTLRQAAPQIDAVDTTGAGDAFCAALAVGIAEGRPIAQALRWATAAGAAACLKPGTSSSMPERAEVDRLSRAI